MCILGAGPHGLAAAVHLRRAQPSTRLVVVDASGSWLSRWHDQMAKAEIATLRSPIVHHPSPDSSALSHHLARRGLPSSGLPYGAPTTEAFASFCDELIADSALDAPIATQPRTVTPEGRGMRIETDDGVINARHVVVASNPHRRQIPDWVWPLLGHRSELFAHASDLDLRLTPDLRDNRVVVIGGGLSAAHLACGAARRGGVVHLVARRPLETRSFDTDPGWLGPKYLRAFTAEPDPARRLGMARAARGGGTIPQWMGERLDALVADGLLVAHEATTIRAALVDPDGHCRLALDDHTTLDADRVWLATGTAPDITTMRCLEGLVADLPNLDGLPILDASLRLGSHPVHVMGRLATLALGPAAGNLWGARRAAQRITEAITGVDLTTNTIAVLSPLRPLQDRTEPPCHRLPMNRCP